MSKAGNEVLAVQTRGPIYYGWWVLLAGAVTEMLAIGSISYAAGLFVVPVEQELSLSRAAASSAIPISFAGAALTAPLVGYLLDRFSAQWVIVLGALALGLGFAAISVTSSLTVMVLALFFAVAFGGMATGPLTTSTLASRWFYKRRGRALGLAAVATSGGGIVVVPLLSLAIEAYGWRAALGMEAVLIVVIVIALALLVIRSEPDAEARASFENRGRPAADIPIERRAALVPYRDILSSLNFWAIMLVLAAITGIDQALVVALVPYGSGLGFAAGMSAFLVSTFSLSAAITKVGSGFLADIIERRTIMLIASAAMIGALALLTLSTSYVLLLIACGLAGTALGCVMPSSAALIAGSFGAASFGRAMGLIYVAVVVSSVVSVPFAGASFDRTGGYSSAFLTFLVLAAVSTIAAMLIRNPAEKIAVETV